MTALPDNWVSTTLGAFADLVNGRAFKPSEWSSIGLPIIRIQNLRNPQAPFNHFAGETDERYRVSNGDLLFAWSGTPGTSFRAYIWEGEEAILNQHIFKVVFNPEVANAHYVKMAINAYLPALMKQAKGGAGLKHLTRATVEAIPVPLAPRAEQDRIVANIQSTVGRLSGIEIELQVLAESASALERQILTDAVTGATAYTDLQNGGVAPTASGAISFPKIKDVGEIQIGRQRSPEVHSGPSMRPYLRVANVLDDRIDASDLMTMNFEDSEFERYRLRQGDILLNEGQSLELVGRAAMYRGEPEEVAFTNTLIRFRAGPDVDPEYALLIFRAYQKNGRFRDIARTTTNLAHLGLRRFAELEFPLRALAEQQTIAAVSKNAIARVRECSNVSAILRTEIRKLVETLESEALAGRFSQQSDVEEPPQIELPEREKRQTQQIGGASEQVPSTIVRNGDMATISLIDALARSGRALDGQELFSAAGYPEDASVLQVEQFFLELRSGLGDGHIRRESEGGERFSIAGSSV